MFRLFEVVFEEAHSAIRGASAASKTGDSWAPCLIKCVNLGKSCTKNPNENRNVFPHIKHFGLGPKLGAV